MIGTEKDEELRHQILPATETQDVDLGLDQVLEKTLEIGGTTEMLKMDHLSLNSHRHRHFLQNQDEIKMEIEWNRF